MALSAMRQVQRTFDWSVAESSAVREASTATAYRPSAECRTGELIRDIVGISSDTFFPLTFGDRLETEISLERLPDVTLEELSSLSPHFGKEELRSLLAAVELGRRVSALCAGRNLRARAS
jgi:hypothetical protein